MRSKGFTLIEVIVASWLVTFALAALLIVLGNLSKQYTFQQNQVVASFFAREGIELSRSILEIGSVENYKVTTSITRTYFKVSSSATDMTKSCVSVPCSIGYNSGTLGKTTPLYVTVKPSLWGKIKLYEVPLTGKDEWTSYYEDNRTAYSVPNKTYLFAQYFNCSLSNCPTEVTTNPYTMSRNVQLTMLRTSSSVPTLNSGSLPLYDAIMITSNVRWTFRGKDYITTLVTTVYPPAK